MPQRIALILIRIFFDRKSAILTHAANRHTEQEVTESGHVVHILKYSSGIVLYQ